jgi:hypothetical protein
MKNSEPNTSSTSISRRDVVGMFTRFLLALGESWYYPGPIL